MVRRGQPVPQGKQDLWNFFRDSGNRPTAEEEACWMPGGLARGSGKRSREGQGARCIMGAWEEGTSGARAHRQESPAFDGAVNGADLWGLFHGKRLDTWSY